MTRSGFVVLGLAFAAGIGIAVLPKTSTAAPAPVAYGQDGDDWGMRGLKNEAQRRGYKEGVLDGRTDFQMHKPLDPDTHRHYVNPPVPPDVADDYRAGFQRGYTVAISRAEGDPSWNQFRGAPEEWQAPIAWHEWKKRGFRDGVDGCRKDYGNNRRPDPNNRDEYRNPHVPGEFRYDYKDGFRKGYEACAAKLYGER